MKNIAFLLSCSLLCIQMLQAQKRVHFSQLEQQRDGKYYQINTIPPFSGTAYDVHPPQNDRQKEKAKTNYEDYLRSAKKKEEIQFKEGKQNGTATGWESNGQKIYETNFKNGVQEGLERQWYPNTKKKLEVTYSNGLPNGKLTEWYESGQIKSTGNYVMGKEDGLHQWWFQSGSKDQEVPYKNGEVFGTVKNWYEKGILKLESNFEDSQHHGQTTEWYDNGQIRAQGNYEKGKEIGDFNSYARDGRILDRKTYKMGELIQTQDFRSAGIRTAYGFVQVFNHKNSHFSVKVKGKNVRTINNGNISFMADGKLIQLLSIPIKGLNLASDANTETILRKTMQSEMQNAESDLKIKLDATQKMEPSQANGKYLHWSFEHPTKNNQVRRVLEEHYLAIPCKDRVLIISGVVTNQHNSSEVIALLKSTLNTLQIANDPIDLNAIRATILKNK